MGQKKQRIADDDLRTRFPNRQPRQLRGVVNYEGCHWKAEVKMKTESVFYRQDNAGCYHCGATIVGASFESRCYGVSVKRLDFSDPQGGKGPCDRKAASLKSHMRVYLNQGSNIETSKEMGDAIQSSGGVPGVDVTLCSSSQNPL